MVDTMEKPAKQPEIKDERNSSYGIMMLKIVGILLIMLMAALAVNGLINAGSTDREVVAEKAEAALIGRFSDTDPGVGPLQEITVYYNGDKLYATWVQGEQRQKRCTAPVLVSEDGTQFGIEAFEPVPFDQQASAPATCLVTEGLAYGLPLESDG